MAEIRHSVCALDCPDCCSLVLTVQDGHALFQHLAERCGVRSTARLVGVNRNTVVRYSRLAGPHAQQIHDEFVAFSPSDPRSPVRREVVVCLQETGAL